MVRRDDTKMQALAASRTLNPRPEKVTDPAFGPGGFFDPADLVQVKYEMVRRAELADVPASRAAAEFGFSRQSLYSARAALRERGLAGLVPAKPGPKGGHKLTGQVVDLLEDLLEADPACGRRIWPPRSGQRFGVSVHPRSVERALQRRRTARREDEQGGEQAPGAAPKSSDQSGSIHQDITAGDDRGAFTQRYEQLRSAAAAGSGGWRHGLGVLLTQGMAAWMAAWTSLPAPGRAGGRTRPQRSSGIAGRRVLVRLYPVPARSEQQRR